jgi:N,N'-diacetylchitobiose transport system substrate-binding protein
MSSFYRRRVTAALALALALVLGVAACGDSSGDGDQASTESGPRTLTIWLMEGSAPPAVVDAVNAEWKKAHPNDTVKVELQQWNNVTTKLDAAFAGSSPPDVVELGNTLVSKYAAAGALQDLTSSRGEFENNQAWLQSLTESCTMDGKLVCAPYLAGSRAVIYRKSMFAKAGITEPPASLEELQADAKKLMATFGDDKRFSAFYFPGKYWYAALPFVWDHGGDIAVQDADQWRGALDSAESQAGLTELKELVDCCSRADKQGDELKQDQAFAQGHIAMIVANGWEKGVILDPKQGNPKLEKDLAAFPLPSRTSGETAPVFLGGSDLGVAAKSKNQDLALDWVKLLAGNDFQTQMATVGGVIPNATTLLDLHAGDPYLSVFDATAKNSRFTPTSPNWANVEAANILPDMLVSIFTERSSVADATKEASTQITDTLNAGS